VSDFHTSLSDWKASLQPLDVGYVRVGDPVKSRLESTIECVMFEN